MSVPFKCTCWKRTHSSESSWSLENLSSSSEMVSLQDSSVYPTGNKPLCLNHFKADMQTVIKIPLFMTVHLTGVHRWAFLSVPLTLTSSLWVQLCVVWYRIRARRCVVFAWHRVKTWISNEVLPPTSSVNSQVCLVFSWDWTIAHSSDICYRPSCMYVPVKLASVRLCH